MVASPPLATADADADPGTSATRPWSKSVEQVAAVLSVASSEAVLAAASPPPPPPPPFSWVDICVSVGCESGICVLDS